MAAELLHVRIVDNPILDLPDLDLTDEEITEFENNKVWKELYRMYTQKIADAMGDLEHMGLSERAQNWRLCEIRQYKLFLGVTKFLRENKAKPSAKCTEAEEIITRRLKEDKTHGTEES